MAEPAGAIHRAARARRRHRLHRPRGRRAHVALDRPAGRGREPHRRRRHDRHGRRAQEPARRLHRADHQRQRGERAAHHESRPTTTPRSCCRSAISAAMARSSPRIRSLGVSSVAELVAYVKSQSRARPRDLGRRLEPARAVRMVQARGRHPDRPRALSRRRPGDQRPDRRACEDRIPRADLADAARPGRHAQAAGAVLGQARADAAGCADAGGGRLQGPGAGSLVRRLRAAGHAAVDHHAGSTPR